MVPYTGIPHKIIHPDKKDISLFTFETASDVAADEPTVKAFGEEWNKFQHFKKTDLDKIGQDYFDLIKLDEWKDCVALDVGCGSGRWAQFLNPYFKFIEAIDPSDSVFSASQNLAAFKNIRVTKAGVGNIPFPDQSFDFVYCLGVLHHIPDTSAALRKCYEKLKTNGRFLFYLYYNFENRGIIFKLIFHISSLFRFVISRLPKKLKHFICDLIAALVYLPITWFSTMISLFSEKIASQIPLSYYRKTSFEIMRNDSLDRFGTPLEKRFSKNEIEKMLKDAGFINITFSIKQPYWHGIAQKA